MDLDPRIIEARLKRERAIAGLGAAIDVMSAWRGRYEDDDWLADEAWVVAVIPECERIEAHREWSTTPIWVARGWLGERGRTSPGVIGWTRIECDPPIFSLSATDGTFCGKFLGEITRRLFRATAGRCGAWLPTIHATLCLSDERHKRPESRLLG